MRSGRQFLALFFYFFAHPCNSIVGLYTYIHIRHGMARSRTPEARMEGGLRTSYV